MQTFLPYPSFIESAMVLDDIRLGNQCYRECKTLLSGGWKHHPAAKMWHGYERYLCYYAASLAQEMSRRTRWKLGIPTKWYNYFMDLANVYADNGPPPWLGEPRFHASHRSNLLRKDPIHYGKFGWSEPSDLEYVWPV